MAVQRILGAHPSASMDFVLHFDGMPDFLSLDGAGRQADSFQIFLAFDPTASNPSNPGMVDILIRGEEIHISRDIRVRDSRPPVPDPAAGGWGALRGTVPYALYPEKDGTAIMTFSAPFSLLGLSGKCAYAVEIYHYGGLVDTVTGVAP